MPRPLRTIALCVALAIAFACSGFGAGGASGGGAETAQAAKSARGSKADGRTAERAAARRAQARRAAAKRKAAKKKKRKKKPAKPPVQPLPGPAVPGLPAAPNVPGLPAPAAPAPVPAPPAPPAPAPAPAPAPPAPAPAPPAPAPAVPAPVPPPPVPGVGPLDVVAPFPTGMRLFAPTSFWNAPLPDDAPLDPDSSRLAGALAAEVQREVVARKGPWINTDQWSVPVYTVGADVAPVRVALDIYKPALQQDFEAVPIPPGARPATGSDGTLVIYQPATDTLWEFFVARRDESGWHARWGGKMTDVSSNPGYFEAPYGGSGTSLALLGGLMTIEEMRARRIDHALAIAVPNTAADEIVWPAQRGDGRTTGPEAIPEGTHFRIDPAVDLTKLDLSPLGLAIARAAQIYGVVVRDTASNVAFYGEDPGPTGGDPYGAIYAGRYPSEHLGNFPWDRLQVVAPRGG